MRPHQQKLKVLTNLWKNKNQLEMEKSKMKLKAKLKCANEKLEQNNNSRLSRTNLKKSTLFQKTKHAYSYKTYERPYPKHRKPI